jgi:arylsulfatase A-like enzyme
MKLSIPLFVCLVSSVLHFSADAAPPKTNILVILADDLGWGELGCQGYARDIPTPHIDSLAGNGVRMTNGYVSGPYCSPTRAGLMTGRYQQRFGHEFNPGPAESAVENFGLSLDEKTLANYLHDAQYATGWFGKSHLGYRPAFHPLKRGFDQFFGFLGGAHDYFDAANDKANPILLGTETVDSMEYATEAFSSKASDFIQKNRDKPWFCYLAYNAVHSPLQATSKYEQRFQSISDQKRRSFAAMLSAMDDGIGNVLSTIRTNQLEEKTLIFFLSDNGGPTAQTSSGNGPLRGFKAQTWEGGIRVPYLVQWKGKIPAGRVDERPVIQLDILPTALAAASIERKPEGKLDGVNLLPYLTGEKPDAPHAALYWRFGKQIALRAGDWKLVKGAGSNGIEERSESGSSNTEHAELYNLKTDIGEKNNLASQEPAKYRELVAMWEAWNRTLVEPQWVPNRGGKATKTKQAAQRTKKKAKTQ